MKKIIFTVILSLILITTVFAQVTEREKFENESLPCGGVERWSVKVLTDADAGSVNYTPDSTTIDSLVHIVTPTANADPLRHPGVEFQTFKVWCKITMKKNESDEDYHLVISDGVNTMIAEAPDPTCDSAATSVQVNKYIQVRDWIETNIGLGTNNNVNLPYVEITGVAFIDPPHGQTGAPPNHIELHPMLEIKFSAYDGINENDKNNLSVDVSPNPFTDEIKVNVISKKVMLKNCSLQLFNADGKIVAEYILPVTAQKQISTVIRSDVQAGTYIYRIMNDNKLLFDGKLIAE